MDGSILHAIEGPGVCSPECEIRESGMWLKQELDKKPRSEVELLRLITDEITGRTPEFAGRRSIEGLIPAADSSAAGILFVISE